MNIKTLAHPLFFFLFIFISFSSPALAYYPLLVNTSVSYGTDTSVVGLQCLNATDNNIYCYVQTQGAIYKYNSTWGLISSCVANNPSTQPYFYMTDNITLYSSEGSCTRYNLTIMSGTCAATNCGGSFYGGLITTGGISQNLVYTNGNVLTTNNSYVEPTAWAGTLSGRAEISVPSKTSNSTVYVATTGYNTQHSDFTKYESGTIATTIDNPMTLWGIGITPGSNDGWGVYCSIVNTNGTDYIYCVDSNTATLNGYTTSWLYKANFSQAVSFTPSTLSAISPSQGQTIKTNENYIPLIANLSTSNNGILYFYYNGGYLTELKINATNINNGVYSTSAPYNGTKGTYTWRSFFVDNTSVQWSTPTITFYVTSGVSANDLLNNPGESLALLIGGFFGTTDQETSENIAAILLALVFSLLIVMITATYGRIHGTAAAMVFAVTFMAFIVFFTMLAWLNAAVMIILVILTALLMAKMLGILGGG